MYESGLGANIALPSSYFGTFAPRTPLVTTRAPVNTYFNAPLALPAPRPIPVTTAALPVPTTKLPVLVPKPPTFGTPTQPSAAPGSPSVNVSVSGGAGVSPSGTVATEDAGMFGGLSDVNPTALIFIGMAALVMFMESGKKGR